MLLIRWGWEVVTRLWMGLVLTNPQQGPDCAGSPQKNLVI
jgi:hypothetical protein